MSSAYVERATFARMVCGQCGATSPWQQVPLYEAALDVVGGWDHDCEQAP